MGAARRPARWASEPRFTRGHRIDLLQRRDRAAARTRCRERRFDRLAQALSLVFGVEALVVLKDIWGLDGGETRAVAQWAAARWCDAAIDGNAR